MIWKLDHVDTQYYSLKISPNILAEERSSRMETGRRLFALDKFFNISSALYS